MRTQRDEEYNRREMQGINLKFFLLYMRMDNTKRNVNWPVQ